MEFVLMFLALILAVLGLIGTVAPILPGTVLSYLGLLCVSFLSGSFVGGSELIWGAIIALIVVLSDYYLPGYFSKLCGGTKAGISGATIGAVLGIFIMGPLGVFLGPFFGAVIGEMCAKKIPLRQAVVVGLGALLSFFVGVGIKLVFGIWAMYMIVVDVITFMTL